MRTILPFLAALVFCPGVAGAAPTPAPSPESALERNFDALIRPGDLRDWMKLLAAEPNHVGSPHDKANADRILAWFKEWGWDAHIGTFWVLYPTPISETPDLGGPKPFNTTLQHPPLHPPSTPPAPAPPPP